MNINGHATESTIAVSKDPRPFAFPNIDSIPGQPIFKSEPLNFPAWAPGTGASAVENVHMTVLENPQQQPGKPLKKARTRLPEKPMPGIGYRPPTKPLVLLANNPLYYNERNDLLGPNIIQAAFSLTANAPFSTSNPSQLAIPRHIRCPPIETTQLRYELIYTGVIPIRTFASIHETIDFLITGDLPSANAESNRQLYTAMIEPARVLDTPGSVTENSYMGGMEDEELDELDKEILALAGDIVD
jgi:hypothetical protein